MKESELGAVISLVLYQMGKMTSGEFRQRVETLSIDELIMLHSKLGEKSLSVSFLLMDRGIGVEEKNSDKYEDINKIVECILLERMKSLFPEDFLPYFISVKNKETIVCLSVGLADAIEERSVKELLFLFKEAKFYLDATDVILGELGDALKLISRQEVIESIEDDIPEMLEQIYLDRLNAEITQLFPKELERIVVACSEKLLLRVYDEIMDKIYAFRPDSLVVFLNNAWKANNAEDTEGVIRDILISRIKNEPVANLLRYIRDIDDTETIDRIIFECLFERQGELSKFLESSKEQKEET